MQAVIEHASNPGVAIPIAAASATANFLATVPALINILTAVYLVMLVCHKGWQMWKEWRDDPTAPGHGDGEAT